MAYIIGEVVAPVTADSSSFDKSMGTVKKAGEVAANHIEQKFKELGKSMERVGKDLTKYITVPLLGVGTAAFKVGKDFEAEMSKIVGLVGVAQEQVDLWAKDIIKMAPELARSPKELAEALYFITSAGIKGAEAMDILEMSAKAAAGGLGETKVIADLVTSAVNAYGKENLSASLATDILVAAVREGKADATEFAGVLGNVLPVASEMGVSFDQVAAATAAMTRTGTDAATANTQLRAILVSLLKPASQAEEALEMMGTSSKKLREQMKEQGLISVLGDLRNLTNQYGEEIMAQVFPNIRALSGALDLMGANAADNIQIFDALANTTNETEIAFATAAQTADFKWQKSLSQVQASTLTLWETLKSYLVPMVENFTNKIAELTIWFNNLDEEQKETIVRFAATAAAIGPVLIVGGKLIGVIAGIKAALIALSGPIGIVIALTAAIGGLAYAATTTSKKVRDATNEKIENYKRMEKQGLEAVDTLYGGEIKALEEKISTEKSLYNDAVRQLEERYTEEINLAKEKSKETIELLEAEKENLDSNYKDRINSINEYYGVVEDKAASLSDIAKEQYEEEVYQATEAHKEKIDLLNIEMQTAVENADEKNKLLLENYQEEIKEARNAHTEKLKLLDEEYYARVRIVDENLADSLKKLQNEIDAIDAKTKEEERILKEKSNQEKILRLENLIDAEENAEKRAEYEKELQDFLSQLERQQILESRKLQQEALKEQIAQEKETAATRKTIIENQYKAEQEALALKQEEELKLIEDRIEEEKEKHKERLEEIQKNYESEVLALETKLSDELVLLETNFEEKIRLIQDERKAKIEAEDDKYIATKEGLENQLKLEEEALNNKIAFINQEKSVALTAEEERHTLIIKDLDNEITKINETANAWRDLLAQQTAIRTEQAKLEEEALGFKGTKLGGLFETVSENLKSGFVNGFGVGATEPVMPKAVKDAAIDFSLNDQIKKVLEASWDFSLQDLIKGKYAKGTSFHPGGLALVGEEGPELINLTRGSSVTPIDYSNMGSNFAINGNFNFYGVQNPLQFMQEMKTTITRYTGRTIM